MNLPALSDTIGEIDRSLGQAANRAVNTLLTARNWLIGFYIVEYEHDGEDRAEYGKSLTEELAKRLDTKGLSSRNLWLFRQFHLAYPQIGLAFTDHPRILQSLTAVSGNSLQPADNQPNEILHPVSAESDFEEKNESSGILHPLGAELNQSVRWKKALAERSLPHISGPKLFAKLSFTHFKALLPIDDPLKRTFYEIEAIEGTWSVRDLKRQIASLYFERSGLSADPARLSEITQEKTPPSHPRHLTKDLYTFEFLGLPGHLAVEESDLETALLGHLQDFLLELGHGFCLEARQKRLLIGEEYFFVDLVFYHRLLKCHVIIELKVGAFSHENAGQLNTYLNYYRAEVMAPDDNPPVGLLLVAEKNNPLVQYATAGMDENLFVKKYLLQLPDKATLANFLNQELNSL